MNQPCSQFWLKVVGVTLLLNGAAYADDMQKCVRVPGVVVDMMKRYGVCCEGSECGKASCAAMLATMTCMMNKVKEQRSCMDTCDYDMCMTVIRKYMRTLKKGSAMSCASDMDMTCDSCDMVSRSVEKNNNNNNDDHKEQVIFGVFSTGAHPVVVSGSKDNKKYNWSVEKSYGQGVNGRYKVTFKHAVDKLPTIIAASQGAVNGNGNVTIANSSKFGVEFFVSGSPAEIHFAAIVCCD